MSIWEFNEELYREAMREDALEDLQFIIDAAEKYAPEYDADEILRELVYNKLNN